jgi:hypothetical protein
MTVTLVRTRDGLPYARPFHRRCRARLPPGTPGGYWGRCDLAPHPPDTSHALERAMLTVRWDVLLRAE